MSSILYNMYDPDVRALWTTLLGSTFILALFLVNFDLSNPYFVVGILVTGLVVAFSATILIREVGN